MKAPAISEGCKEDWSCLREIVEENGKEASQDVPFQRREVLQVVWDVCSKAACVVIRWRRQLPYPVSIPDKFLKLEYRDPAVSDQLLRRIFRPSLQTSPGLEVHFLPFVIDLSRCAVALLKRG